MIRSTSIREFNSFIDECRVGDVIYISAIGLSVKAIDRLRSLIRDGFLIPQDVSVYMDRRVVLDGDVILPQCNYLVNDL